MALPEAWRPATFHPCAGFVTKVWHGHQLSVLPPQQAAGPVPARSPSSPAPARHSCANSTDLPLNKGATSRGGESRVPAPYCPVTTSGSLWAGPSWAYPPWNDPRRDDGLALVEGGRFAVPLLLLISSISSHCVSMSTHFQQPDGGRPGACGAAGDNSSVPCHVLPPLPLETCWCLEGY